MNKNNFILLLLISFLATFLRLYIDNNFVISIVGSLLYGFIIPKKINSVKKELLLSGFCSCFTSFSGFMNSLYILLNNTDFVRFFFYLNFVIILNLFVMYFGYLISRKTA